ncbi:MAG: polyprenyl synthetase family protein [Deltaproteobacteria bacterium]|nr:polyprenyl synthetase family protein [Deltaproteobacteria bacterium]
MFEILGGTVVGSNHGFLDRFNQRFFNINEAIQQCFETRVSIIEDIGKHSLFNEGKRLRPLLFVLSCDLCGYDKEDVYRLSAIFEFVHTASLLHDDVMDNAEIRRNRPSASHLWGNPAAVMAGDYLSSLSGSIAIRTNNLAFLKALIETGTKMSEGQALELVHTRKWDIKEDVYMDIIISKTASLMSAACLCAGIIGGINDQGLKDLSRFGLNLGIAFQLIDDLLDYISTEKTIGKPVGKDLREGKITLPLIYAFPDLEHEKQNEIRDILEKDYASNEEYGRIITYVRNSDAIDKVRTEAMRYKEMASDSLNAFHDSPSKDELLALNDYLLDRNY